LAELVDLPRLGLSFAPFLAEATPYARSRFSIRTKVVGPSPAVARGAGHLSSTISWRDLSLAAMIVAIVGASSVRAGQPAPAAPMRLAQSGSLPPSDIPGGSMAEGDDSGALVLRIDRLENQLRAANGSIEELQNQQHRLEEQLKHFQEDVEFRLNGAKGAPPVAEAATPARPMKRSDAFDPGADPNAVGAPRPLGTTTPSAPLANAPTTVGAPLDLSRGGANAATPSGPLASAEEPAIIPGIGGPPDDPREQYNSALEAYRVGQYDEAEQKLHAFLAKNGGSRWTPDAIFLLGESYFKRSRPREAAEQYLKLSTDYSKSPRAPEGMLRLGQSLAALGNNDQACATFGEVGRRYPTATTTVKKNIELEMQKDHC
jgi:tol-pal system protein YbgF